MGQYHWATNAEPPASVWAPHRLSTAPKAESLPTATISRRLRRRRASSGAPLPRRSPKPTRRKQAPKCTRASFTGSSAPTLSTAPGCSPSQARPMFRPSMRIWNFQPWLRKAFPSRNGGNGGAILTFTASGHTAFGYPSTAFGRLSSTSNGLVKSLVNIVDLGESPHDGFTEYQGYPGSLRPRWGDYSHAIYLSGSGKIYFANNYSQYANCIGDAFTLTLGTCDGTRDGFANWGTSVNFVVP